MQVMLCIVAEVSVEKGYIPNAEGPKGEKRQLARPSEFREAAKVDWAFRFHNPDTRWSHNAVKEWVDDLGHRRGTVDEEVIWTADNGSEMQ